MTDATAAVEHLARRLAYDHGHLMDDGDWERAHADLRKDYRDLADATLAVLGGPTEAQQRVAELDAEAQELRRQRDRYRDAWKAACHARTKLRRKPC